jgi:hypothetical protein
MEIDEKYGAAGRSRSKYYILRIYTTTPCGRYKGAKTPAGY